MRDGVLLASTLFTSWINPGLLWPDSLNFNLTQDKPACTVWKFLSKAMLGCQKKHQKEPVIVSQGLSRKTVEDVKI